MKNNTSVASLNFPLVTSLDFVKRLTLVGGQAFLDVAILWACFNAVKVFWGVDSIFFWADIKIFFYGAALICFYSRSLYSFRNWTFWDEMREVLMASVMLLLVIALCLFAFRLQISRVLVVFSVVLFAPTSLLVRYFIRQAAVSAGFLRTSVLIIGAGKSGKLYAQRIASHTFMGCSVLGFLDDNQDKLGTNVAGAPVLGKTSDFQKVVQDMKVDEVVVAIPSAKREFLSRVLHMVNMRVKNVSYIPDIYMLATFSAYMRDIDGLPIVSAPRGLMNPINRFLKNVMDYVGATVALVLFSPIFLYVAWKIKKDDGGIVIFNQIRTGKDLTRFSMYKFRTMVPNAEEKLAEILKDENVKREYEVAFKLKDDPRITKIGRFLRRSSLDELPQLLNVLKGEMSLIGPRPFVPQEIEPRYGNMAQQVYSVKPGLSGMWQVSGRNDILDYQQSRDLDLYYIHNWSIWLDIVILFRTLQILIKADGAY